MAIDHDSPFKELRLKNRRIMGGSGPEPEESASAAHGEQWPRWLHPLLSARFFAQCKTHVDSHRSGECNKFCLDCSAATPGAGALCSLCLAHGHRDHHTIQIRRSSYHDVIRVSDIQRFMDIAGVQTYVINGARVVFLNERPQQQKPGCGSKAASANLCEVCARSLLDNFRFCSLGCKVVGCSPDAAKARNWLLRAAASSDGSTSSSSSLRNAGKKQSFTPPTPPTLPAKRRKGIPHRAPFGSLIVEY
ncbi:protein RGF1 INDUCIBLE TRANSCRIPTION FACTOR 1-like [Phragmites australis]|uniref:protein RGF1 INDUCIBLE TRANSCRIPTION FACTOR 1-like n=1 Tax=Phragmites australis TaxID=29695 RepID=UPI002D7A2487|nr:protein RGF1 INDUCIBLE TRANSCRIPTION FACTOR 1-like [Phragmites australis]